MWCSDGADGRRPQPANDRATGSVTSSCRVRETGSWPAPRSPRPGAGRASVEGRSVGHGPATARGGAFPTAPSACERAAPPISPPRCCSLRSSPQPAPAPMRRAPRRRGRRSSPGSGSRGFDSAWIRRPCARCSGRRGRSAPPSFTAAGRPGPVVSVAFASRSPSVVASGTSGRCPRPTARRRDWAWDPRRPPLSAPCPR